MKNILPQGHTFPTENTGESNLGNLPLYFFLGKKQPQQMCMFSCNPAPRGRDIWSATVIGTKETPGDRRGWMLLSQYTYTVNPFLWTIRAFTP